jgi:hypothetical protein
MKYRKFNKYEKKEIRAEHIREALHGEGLYLFRNNTNGDLKLPRPTSSGQVEVKFKREFQGDNYYMRLVPQFLKLVKVLQDPEVSPINEATSMDDKLIVDQPDTIKSEGKVEHVVNKVTPVQKMNEGNKESQPDVLLNEAPVDGGFVIVQ